MREAGERGRIERLAPRWMADTGRAKQMEATPTIYDDVCSKRRNLELFVETLH